jgi:hypothetical protein
VLLCSLSALRRSPLYIGIATLLRTPLRTCFGTLLLRFITIIVGFGGGALGAGTPLPFLLMMFVQV